MRTQSICLALAIVLVCPFTSAQWVQTNCPLPTDSSSLYLLTVVGTSLYAGSDGDGILLRSRDNGNHWDTLGVWSGRNPGAYWCSWGALIEVDSILVAEVHEFVPKNGPHYWYIVRSDGRHNWDGGRTWTDTTLTDCVVGFLQMGSRLYSFGMDGTILSSANLARTWETVQQVGLPTDGFLSSVVSKGAMMFCSTSNDGIFRSTSSGESWDSASGGLRRGYWGSLAASNLEVVDDALFCRNTSQVNGYDVDSVFRSTNDGMTWSNASSGLSGDLSLLGSSGHLLFAATSSGLFVSTDRGDSWNLWSEGLPHNSPPQYLYYVNSMAFSDGFAFVQSTGGVWRRPLTEIPTSVPTLLDEIPNQFSLHQNYPNPFNPSTTIKYELPKTSHVSLCVYDILGREVSVLVNERKEAGVYEVKFDASGLASGMYFYRLQAGTFVQTRKLLLLK